jgi:hypothetical protein
MRGFVPLVFFFLFSPYGLKPQVSGIGNTVILVLSEEFMDSVLLRYPDVLYNVCTEHFLALLKDRKKFYKPLIL